MGTVYKLFCGNSHNSESLGLYGSEEVVQEDIEHLRNGEYDAVRVDIRKPFIEHCFDFWCVERDVV